VIRAAGAVLFQQPRDGGFVEQRPRGAASATSLRSYVRQRKMLVEYAASHVRHIQKGLAQMNLQLHNVVSDLTGTTGMKILRAILDDERDPQKLASYR
jgi:hypothetical protein